MIAFLVLIGSVAVYGQGQGHIHNHSCAFNNHHQIAEKQVVVNIIADMDKDGDGIVELPEVNAEFISRYDVDKDGEVLENEFVRQWHQRYHDDRDFVGYLFHNFDTNDDQKLTAADLAALAKTLDADGNGQVSSAEFQSFMINLYVNCVPSKYSHGP
ncbi:uncharacterized protein LOC124283067 [Haliotis rubra]|uniref:uncharacterized protein LOC124283067 n=1 Tax=Haliotis rubra TaxID=36100 RepID=UPI001EE61C12|nr:uncharacterized protein LOC124283067 [Haliotis rubra]